MPNLAKSIKLIQYKISMVEQRYLNEITEYNTALNYLIYNNDACLSCDGQGWQPDGNCCPTCGGSGMRR